MDDFQMLLCDGWLARERVVSRSPNPDAVLTNAGNQDVMSQPGKTLHESDWPAAAERDDWPIPVLNRLTIMLSNF